jgi:hypothetical protein
VSFPSRYTSLPVASIFFLSLVTQGEIWKATLLVTVLNGLSGENHIAFSLSLYVSITHTRTYARALQAIRSRTHLSILPHRTSVTQHGFANVDGVAVTSGVPRNFVRGRGSTNSVEERGQRERGSGGGSLVVRGSGGSCSFVQEISFHIVKFS